VMAASAQERTWGFDKDTVYEWNAGGDTVRLANMGLATLTLDSVFAESVQSFWSDVSFNYRSDALLNSYLLEQHAQPHIGINTKIPEAKIATLSAFGIYNMCVLGTASGPSTTNSDTATVKLIFTTIS